MTSPAVVSVYGERIDGERDVEGLVYEGGCDVHVSLAGEHAANGDAGGATHRCATCEQELNEEWFQSSDGRQDGYVWVGRQDSRPGVCPEADDDDQPHDVQAIALAWANSASIRMDEKEDRIIVSISVGDPRGAFAMSIERYQGQLRLSVPSPEDGMLHMPLTPLASPGYYAVGG